MKKRVLSIILILTLLSAFASACGGSESAAPTDLTEADDNAETEPEETTPPEDRPDITEADYGGAVFNIIYPKWSLYNNFYFAEENNGEAVNDAIFERTQKIEEAFNITIVPNPVGAADGVYGKVNKTVMAGDSAYQLVLTHCATSLTNYVKQQIVVNWNDMPNIDMSKSYWNQSVSKSMGISGVLPFNANAFILPDVNSIFFNTKLYENYIGDNLYAAVLDGSWTWDMLIQTAEKGSLDIDGDGQFTESDQYGFVGELDWQFASIPTSCGLYIVSIDQDEGAYISINSEKTVSLIDKFKSMMYGGNTAFTWTYNQKYDPNVGGTPPVSFNDGKAMYYLVPLSLASAFRSMDTDFGIVPLPKYDENQDDYITLNWSGFMCVPMTAGDLEMVGNVVENLGWINDEIVVPAFYQILLGQKIARNDESAKMLDIIFEDSVYDLGVNLGLYNIMTTCVSSANAKEFASYYEERLNGWNQTVSDYTDACVEYAEERG